MSYLQLFFPESLRICSLKKFRTYNNSNLKYEPVFSECAYCDQAIPLVVCLPAANIIVIHLCVECAWLHSKRMSREPREFLWSSTTPQIYTWKALLSSVISCAEHKHLSLLFQTDSQFILVYQGLLISNLNMLEDLTPIEKTQRVHILVFSLKTSVTWLS